MPVQQINKFFGEYRFLSNFWISWVVYCNVKYKTNEHFFQAMKTLDVIWFFRIVNAGTATEAKDIGRAAPLRPGWKDNQQHMAKQVMKLGISMKFSIPELRAKLLKTGGAYLTEGNYWHDNFWGDCHCSKCANIEGQNNLGLIIMEERLKIQSL